MAANRITQSFRKETASIKKPEQHAVLSAASLWELQIKIQNGKFSFPKPLREIVEEQQTVNDLQILPIKPEHVYALENLPFHHKDPFDRLLIAQSIVENLTLATDDPQFSVYGAKLL